MSPSSMQGGQETQAFWTTTLQWVQLYDRDTRLSYTRRRPEETQTIRLYFKNIVL